MEQKPLYKKITDDIKTRCSNSEFVAGDRMFSIDELRRMYSVSSTTAVKAVNELKRDGIIKSVKGKGSFFLGALSIKVSNGGSRMKSVAVLSHKLNFFRNTFQSSICDGIEQAVSDAGLGLRLQYLPEEQGGVPESMPFHPDASEGLIMIDIIIKPEILALTRHSGLKSVFVDNVVPGVPASVSDNYHGMRELVDHLTSLGHFRFLLAAANPGSMNQFNENERINAFNFLMSDRGLKGNVVRSDDHDAVLKGVAGKEGATAVVFTQDDPALAFIGTAKEKGIRIPLDISIAGFDNFASKQEGLDELTTYAVDLVGLGKIAVKLLLEQNGNVLKPWIPVKGELKVRRTTGERRDK